MSGKNLGQKPIGADQWIGRSTTQVDGPEFPEILRMLLNHGDWIQRDPSLEDRGHALL